MPGQTIRNLPHWLGALIKGFDTLPPPPRSVKLTVPMRPPPQSGRGDWAVSEPWWVWREIFFTYYSHSSCKVLPALAVSADKES